MIVYPTNCIPFAVPNSIKYPCKLYFNADGIYFSQPANNLPCCSLFPGVGPVPPAFLAGFNYSNVENANDYSVCLISSTRPQSPAVTSVL